MDNERFKELMNELKVHEGWEEVKNYIDKQIRFHEQQLLNCSLDKVEKHRHMREALVLVLSFIDGEGE